MGGDTDLRSLKQQWLVKLPTDLVERLQDVNAELVIETLPSHQKVTTIVVDDDLMRCERALSVLSRRGLGHTVEDVPLTYDMGCLQHLSKPDAEMLRASHEDILYQKRFAQYCQKLLRGGVIDVTRDTTDHTLWPHVAVLQDRIFKLRDPIVPTEQLLQAAKAVHRASQLSGTFALESLPPPTETFPVWAVETSNSGEDDSLTITGKITHRLSCSAPHRYAHVSEIAPTQWGQERLTALSRNLKCQELGDWGTLVASGGVVTAHALEGTFSGKTPLDRRLGVNALVARNAAKNGRASIAPGVYFVPLLSLDGQPVPVALRAVVHGPAVKSENLDDEFISRWTASSSSENVMTSNGAPPMPLEFEIMMEEDVQGFKDPKSQHMSQDELRERVIAALSELGDNAKEADVKARVGKHQDIRPILDRVARMTNSTRRLWSLKEEYVR